MPAKPAYDCAASEKNAGAKQPPARTLVQVFQRLDLRREPTGALLIKLQALSQYLKDEEQSYRGAGIEVRCELLNEFISALDEVLVRARAKLARSVGVPRAPEAKGTNGTAH